MLDSGVACDLGRRRHGRGSRDLGARLLPSGDGENYVRDAGNKYVGTLPVNGKGLKLRHALWIAETFEASRMWGRTKGRKDVYLTTWDCIGEQVFAGVMAALTSEMRVVMMMDGSGGYDGDHDGDRDGGDESKAMACK